MSTVNMELEQARKNIKKVATVFNVVKIVTLAVAGVLAVIGLLALIFSSKVESFVAPYLMSGDVNLTEEIRVLGINLHRNFAAADVRVGVLVSGYFIGFAVLFGIVAIIMEQIYKVMRCIYESESPFAPEAIKKIKVGFIGIAIVVLLSSGLMLAAFVGLIEWSIYSVFKYGTALQTEADETL